MRDRLPIAQMVRLAGRYPAGSPGGRGGRFRCSKRRWVWTRRDAERFEALGFECRTDLYSLMGYVYEREFLRHFSESIKFTSKSIPDSPNVEWFQYA